MGRPVQFQQLPDDQVEAAREHGFLLMFPWTDTVGFSVYIPVLRQRFGIRLISFAELVATAEGAKGQPPASLVI